MRAATTLLATTTAFGLANAACSIVKNVKTTFYGWDDNTPVGDETTFNCGGRNNHAGGVGTYANPLTFASDPSEYNTCEIVYVPYLQKYLRMEDKCYACSLDIADGLKHIDVWAGHATGECEDDLNPDSFQDVIRSPPTNLPVKTGALFDGSCHTKLTYPGAVGSCTGPPFIPTPPTTCQTDCDWEGHCVGCSCGANEDCNDRLRCRDGVCAQL